MVLRFRPPWWSILATAVLGAVMLSAGFWQLDRAAQKRALQANYERAAATPPQILTVETAPPPGAAPLRVRARGRYLPERQLWLDNQVSEGVAGYRIWTPLALESGGIVMVDRGWLASSGSRERLPPAPAPEAPQLVDGFWREWPRAAIHVANAVCAEGASPVVQYPRFEELRCLFEAPLADGLLLLSPAAEHGYRRAWNLVEVPPERHLGYALQWFAFTATLLGLFVGLNLKRRP